MYNVRYVVRGFYIGDTSSHPHSYLCHDGRWMIGDSEDSYYNTVIELYATVLKHVGNITVTFYPSCISGGSMVTASVSDLLMDAHLDALEANELK